MKKFTRALTVSMILAFTLGLTLPAFAAGADGAKKRPSEDILVTVQGVLTEVEAQRVRLRTASGKLVYVPRQRVELKGREVGQSKISARMTMAELATLNPFYHPELEYFEVPPK